MFHVVKEGRGKEGRKSNCKKATGGMAVVMGEMFCISVIWILYPVFLIVLQFCKMFLVGEMQKGNRGSLYYFSADESIILSQ